MKPSFLDISSPGEYKKLLGSGFLRFRFFPDFWVILRRNFGKNAIFWAKWPHMYVKNRNLKNLLPNNFLYSPGLLISKKLGFMGQNWETSYKKRVFWKSDFRLNSYTKPRKMRKTITRAKNRISTTVKSWNKNEPILKTRDVGLLHII